jgi:mRNA interferase RelE/StbE
MQGAILRCIRQLRTDPRHPSLRTKKMKGTTEDVYEVRIDQGNRLTFHWEGGTIVLRNHCNHDILRRP